LKKRPNYIYAIVSVSLVLFTLGFFALTALHGRKLVSLFKEKVDVWLELKSEIPQSETDRIVELVRAQPFVKAETVAFITKEAAATALKEDLGAESVPEDAPGLLRDVVRFNVKAEFLNDENLNQWREELRRDSSIAELFFEAANVGNVSKNIENLGWITLGLGILLIFAAITLIHNTIRLALYANRFLIKNQELVGASWRFISQPFIQRGILNGLWSAVIAILALMACVWGVQKLIPDVQELQDLSGMILIFIGLIILGVLISGLSTLYVVNKFLKMRIDDLY
jgi:cell division transport system permease protein